MISLSSCYWLDTLYFDHRTQLYVCVKSGYSFTMVSLELVELNFVLFRHYLVGV